MVPSRIWRLWPAVFFSFGAGRRGRRRRGLRDMMWRDFWTIFENRIEIVCNGGRRGLEDLEDFEGLWRTLKDFEGLWNTPNWCLPSDRATYQPGLGTAHTAVGGRGHGGGASAGLGRSLTLVSRLPSHSREGGSICTRLFSRWVNFSVCCWFKKKKKNIEDLWYKYDELNTMLQKVWLHARLLISML